MSSGGGPQGGGGGGGNQGGGYQGGGYQGGGGGGGGDPGNGGSPFQGSPTRTTSFRSSATAATTFKTSTISSSATSAASEAASSAASSAAATSIVSNDMSTTVEGAIIGGTLGGLVLLVPLLILAYRRWRRNQQHKKSIGGTPRAGNSLLRPWKKKEMELKNKIQDLETLINLRVAYDPKNPDHHEKPAPAQIFVNQKTRSSRSMSLDSGVDLAAVGAIRTSVRMSQPNLGGRPGLAACRASQIGVFGPGQRLRFQEHRSLTESFLAPRPLDLVYDRPVTSPETSPQSEMQSTEPRRVYTGQIRPGMGVQRRNTDDSIRPTTFF